MTESLPSVSVSTVHGPPEDSWCETTVLLSLTGTVTPVAPSDVTHPLSRSDPTVGFRGGEVCDGRRKPTVPVGTRSTNTDFRTGRTLL